MMCRLSNAISQESEIIGSELDGIIASMKHTKQPHQPNWHIQWVYLYLVAFMSVFAKRYSHYICFCTIISTHSLLFKMSSLKILTFVLVSIKTKSICFIWFFCALDNHHAIKIALTSKTFIHWLHLFRTMIDWWTLQN